MNGKLRLLIAAGVLVWILCCSCTHVAGIDTVGARSFKKASLSGIVLDERGIPVPDAEVILDGEKATVSGKDGRFVFPGAASGEHTVKAEAYGFEPMPSTRIIFTDRTGFLVLRITRLASLVDEAAEHISRGSLDEADVLLSRCEAAGGTPASRLLRGVFLYITGDYAGALNTARGLIREGLAEEGAAVLAERSRLAQSTYSNAVP